MQARVGEGAALLVVDGVVHDVQAFMGRHPAGPAFIKPYLGKDATEAFHGGVYNHSHAAMNILRTLRVARMADDDAACDAELMWAHQSTGLHHHQFSSPIKQSDEAAADDNKG